VNIARSRNFWSDMLRHSDGRLYLDFAVHGEDDVVRAAVGADVYARLVEVKRKYDSTNFFRVNQNIPLGQGWLSLCGMKWWPGSHEIASSRCSSE
jgi:Berberine and berberine like